MASPVPWTTWAMKRRRERAGLLDALEADLGRLYQFQDPALREEPAGDPVPPAPEGPASARRDIGLVRALAPVVGGVALSRSRRSRT